MPDTKRPRGRPPGTGKGAAKYPRISVTLPPEALALIDAQPGDRSTLIAGLIVKAWG